MIITNTTSTQDAVADTTWLMRRIEEECNNCFLKIVPNGSVNIIMNFPIFMLKKNLL